MAGPADLRRGPEHLPGLANVAIALAEMDSVGSEPPRKGDAVVDDEGGLRIGADALKRLGEERKLMLVFVLDAELERRRQPRLERRLQPVREAPADLLRADQVQPARPALAGGEGGSELAGDLVRRQAGTFWVEAS